MSIDVPRIKADKVRQKVQAGENTLLVCAYDDADKCNQVGLEGSIHLKDLQQKLPTLAKNQELIFYCA
jgi:hypothetical protein